MRLSNVLLVVSAVALLASGDALSANGDQSTVSKVAASSVVHSSHVLAGEDKRFLRSHKYVEDDDDDDDSDDDMEERANSKNMFNVAKLAKMVDNDTYAYKKFATWSKKGHSSSDLYDYLTKKGYGGLYNRYYNYRRDMGHAN